MVMMKERFTSYFCFLHQPFLPISRIFFIVILKCYSECLLHCLLCTCQFTVFLHIILRSAHTEQERPPVRSAEESIDDLEMYQEQVDADFQMGLANAFEADLQTWMEEQGTPESTAEDDNESKTGNQPLSTGECPPLESSSELLQDGVQRMSQSLREEVVEDDGETESDGEAEEEKNKHERQLLKRTAKVLECPDTESGELVDKDEEEEEPPTKKENVEQGYVEDEEEEEPPTKKQKVKEEEVEEGELSSDNNDKVSQLLLSIRPLSSILAFTCCCISVAAEPEQNGG